MMPHSTVNAIALPQSDHQNFIRADELTQGDIICHLGSNWQVISEPEYTNRGITFEVLWLDFKENNTQEVSFDPRWKFELLDYQRMNTAVVLSCA